MSITSEEPAAVAENPTERPGDDMPPHRYTGTLAEQIELGWQDRWTARAPSTRPTRPARCPTGSTALRCGRTPT